MLFAKKGEMKMNIVQLIKIIIIFPFVGISAILQKNKSLEIRYQKAQKWSQWVIKYLGYTLEVEGIENIPMNGALYFVSNHQGTIDPALVVASCPRIVSFISKKENEKIPVLGQWAKNIDTIHFDRESREGNVHMLREALRYLKKEKNLLIFPEGTRSKSKQMNPFKEGALQPAYLGKATIVPVTLNNAFCLNVKKNKIKQLKITYGQAISYEQYKDMKYADLSNYLHQEIKKNII